MQKLSTYNRIFLGGLLTVLLLLGAFNAVIDPFDRNRVFDLHLPKQTVSSLLNYQMYKILRFNRHPQPVIILGDSRSDALETEYFAELGEPDVFNFSYGGGTLYEAIDTFWYAARRTELREVVLGIPFPAYNETNSLNRFPTAEQVTRNPLAYYLSPLVTKASLMNLLTAITGHQFISETPELPPDEFWQYQLGPGVDRIYRTWRRPSVLRARLEAMVTYCRLHHIKLVVFVPPTHRDLQDLVAEYGLRAEYRQYKTDLAKLGPVVLDYDQPGPLTDDRANFSDPHHFTVSVARRIVSDIVALGP